MRPKLIWKENGAAICHLGNKLYGIVICGQLLIPIMMHEMSLEIVLTCGVVRFLSPAVFVKDSGGTTVYATDLKDPSHIYMR